MTLIIGHRGAAGSYPENTMMAFKKAKDAGADGVELDVQMTKDGELVVIHDETVDRTTNGSGFVKDLSYLELSRLEANYMFPQYIGKTSIPRLTEVLEWVCDHKSFVVNIELKNSIIDYPNLEEKTIELIQTYNLTKQVILSSFNHYSLVKCKDISPEVETAILYMEGLYKPWVYASKIGAKGLHPYYLAVNSDIIFQSKQHGVEVRPFTVNDKTVMQQLISNKCAAFITDFPEIAKELVVE